MRSPRGIYLLRSGCQGGIPISVEGVIGVDEALAASFRVGGVMLFTAIALVLVGRRPFK